MLGKKLIAGNSGLQFQEISAGTTHSLFLTNAGVLFSCGSNGNAATGQGTTVGNTLTPTRIGANNDWVGISAGGNFSFFIKTDGTLYSCGSNDNGGTGQGTTAGDTLTPTQIGSATDWAAISAGGQHSLFLKTDGTIYSCGVNAGGRTGLGTDTGNTLTPTQIGSATDWAAVSAGAAHSLFLKTDGTIYSCGNNAVGSTGQGTTAGDTLTPTQIGSATDWAGISAGSDFSLFIKTDGRIYACGTNANGRTGQGTTVGNELTPTQIGSATDWDTIEAGGQFSLFIKADNTLYSCGDNTDGRTGLGTDTGNTLTPTQIGSDDDWEKVAAGVSAASNFSLFVKTSKIIYSCGDNTGGRTGQNTDTGNLLIPTLIEEFALN